MKTLIAVLVLLLVLTCAGCNRTNAVIPGAPGGPVSVDVDPDADPDAGAEPCQVPVCYCAGTHTQSAMIDCDQWPAYRDQLGAVAGFCVFPGQPCVL